MQFEELLAGMRTQSSRLPGRGMRGIEQTAATMTGLTDAERRSLAPQVAALARVHSTWWRDDSPRPKESVAATALAVAGTLTASKLAGVLRRLSQEDVSERTNRTSQALVASIIKILQARGLAEDARLGAELARRVREGDSYGNWYFVLAREILQRSPGEPPVHPAFVQVWLQRTDVLADVRARPDWSVLVLGALPSRGLGQLLDNSARRDVLIRLTVERLVPRADLLDAVVGALQATDRKVDLYGLIALHEQLDPSGEEVHTRAGQYVRLTAAAPAFVATLAQQRLRALEEVGRLPAAVLAETTAAILVRPDKGLFKAQLTWLRTALRAATPPEREALILSASVGLGHPDPALQKKLLDLLRPYGKTLSDRARQELALAAGALAPDLRPLAAELTGSDDSAGPLPVVQLLVPLPPQNVEPICDPELLVEELAVFYRGYDSFGQVDFQQTERCLDALVRFAWSDPEQLHAALAPLMMRLSWLPEGPPRRIYGREVGSFSSTVDALGLCVQAARACANRPVGQRHQQELAPEELLHPKAGHHFWRAGSVLMKRVAEAGTGIWWAPVPVLLATPTTADGVLEADELLRRLQLVEAAGCRPWPNDLEQAWLRVRPADRGRVLDVIRRVAGEESASRLSALGAAQATVSLKPWTRQTREAEYYYREAEYRTDLIAVLAPSHPLEGPGTWNRLWWLPVPSGGTRFSDRTWLSCWPAILPFDPDVIAAHLHRELLELGRRPGEVIRGHAQAPGPIGPASLLLYCDALNSSRAEDRVGAADALIIRIGRGELDTTAFGHLLGRLVADRLVKLNRVVEALRGVGAAGGYPALWEILAAALPRCLPVADEEPPARLADLVALAVEAAQVAGATDPVAGLGKVSARKGASRLRSEARRLSSVLAG